MSTPSYDLGTDRVNLQRLTELKADNEYQNAVYTLTDPTSENKAQAEAKLRTLAVQYGVPVEMVLAGAGLSSEAEINLVPTEE